MKEQLTFIMKSAYVEIYNEQINDLLTNPINKNLKMREFPGVGV